MSTLGTNLYGIDSQYVDQKTVESLSEEISKIITEQFFKSLQELKENERTKKAPAE